MKPTLRAPDGLAGDALDSWLDEQIRARRAQGMVTPLPRAEGPAPPDPASLLEGIGCVARFELPSVAPSACRGGCGAVLTPPGVCEACAAKRRAAEIEAHFARAVGSVPPEFQWVRDAGGELDERCPVCSEGGRVNPRAVAWRAAADLLVGRKLLIAISSPATGDSSRTGKSALAARILFALVDRGAALAAKSWPLPVPEPRDASIARRARWMQAVSLADRVVRPGDIAPVERAEIASVLVLNDVGQENAEGWGGAERRAVVRKLLLLRWDLGRPTVITHALTEQSLADWYGGGIHGRIYDDARGARIEVRRG